MKIFPIAAVVSDPTEMCLSYFVLVVWIRNLKNIFINFIGEFKKNKNTLLPQVGFFLGLVDISLYQFPTVGNKSKFHVSNAIGMNLLSL